MNGRELHQAIYAGEQFGHLPIRGLWGWRETHERWESEGMPAGKNPNEAHHRFSTYSEGDITQTVRSRGAG